MSVCVYELYHTAVGGLQQSYNSRSVRCVPVVGLCTLGTLRARTKERAMESTTENSIVNMSILGSPDIST